MKEFIQKNKTALIFITLVFISAITGLFLLNFKNIPEKKSELTNLEKVTKKFVEKEIILNQNTGNSSKKIGPDYKSNKTISTSSRESKNSPNFNPKQTTSSSQNKTVETTENKNSFTVKLVITDQEFETSLEKKSTVYAVMQKISTENSSFSFTGKLYNNLGFFVDSINNIKNDYQKGEYWILYINGEKSKVGVSSYLINEGDIISWKYEKSL